MGKHNPSKIKTAVIGGSGAYQQNKSDWGSEGTVVTINTPFGVSAPLHSFFPEDAPPFVFLSRHGEQGYRTSAPYVNYRANIWALKDFGIEKIVGWSGPGAISEAFKPGDYVIPHDLIDFTKNRITTFFQHRGLGFIRQSHPFCPQGRQALQKALGMTGTDFHDRGVYLCTEGPRLETAAEIAFFSMIGAHMVGMTLIPEVFLARELEMCYSALCYITNYAEGVRELPYREGELFEGTLPGEEAALVDEALLRIGRLLPRIVEHQQSGGGNCSCREAMLRYRKRGDINDDWRTWIERE